MEEQDGVQNDVQEREKLRSPNYPAFGLGDAVTRADALFKKEGKASIPTVAAVKAWGYNSLNGRSLRALGALRQYGLLEDTGPKMVRLSQLALIILRSPADSPERATAIQEAARRPPIFSTLFEMYPDGIPSDDAMVSHLEINSTYSGDAPRKLIAAFRDTLNLVESVAGRDTSASGDTDGEKSGDERRSPDQKPKKREGTMPEVGENVISMDLPIPVIGGGQATLRMPRHMTEQAYTHFVSVLTATLNAWKPAVVTQPNTGSTDGSEEEA